MKKKNPNKTNTVIAVVLAVLALGSGAFLGYCKFYGKCALKREQARIHELRARTVAQELVTYYRESSVSELRKHLVQLGPEQVLQSLRMIDNTIDTSGKARLGILRVIGSFSADGFSDQMLVVWAETLRSGAQSVLRDGPEFSHFIAQSYLMQGKRTEAAHEYRRFQDSVFADRFFAENPELRSPASR